MGPLKSPLWLGIAVILGTTHRAFTRAGRCSEQVLTLSHALPSDSPSRNSGRPILQMRIMPLREVKGPVQGL